MHASVEAASSSNSKAVSFRVVFEKDQKQGAEAGVQTLVLPFAEPGGKALVLRSIAYSLCVLFRVLGRDGASEELRRVYVWGLDLRDERQAQAFLSKKTFENICQVSAPPWQVPEFGPERWGAERWNCFFLSRPVVALTCGAHFIVCSAEVVPGSWPFYA